MQRQQKREGGILVSFVDSPRASKTKRNLAKFAGITCRKYNGRRGVFVPTHKDERQMKYRAIKKEFYMRPMRNDVRNCSLEK